MMDPMDHLQMLKDRAAGLPPREGDFTRIRALRFTDPGFDRDEWRRMCGRGWLAMTLPEAVGGEAQPVSAFCALAEQLGRDLVPEPVVAAAMAAQLLPPQHLPPVLAGDRLVLPAWQEQPGSLDPLGETVLRDGRLSGRKILVPMAGGADAFLVTVPGGLALVERSAPGLVLDLRQTEDGGTLGTLVLNDAPAEELPGDAVEALEGTILAAAAYLTGVIDRALALTEAHVQARLQAGRHAAALPALQHRAEDMAVQVALTEGAIGSAADVLDGDQPRAVRQAAVSRAKLRATDAAIVVSRACTELLGGMATDRMDVVLCLRKAAVLAPLYGPASLHRARSRAAAQENRS